ALVRKLENPGAGQDVAIFGEAAEEMRILIGEIVPVFAHAVALLRHVVDVAVVALPVEEILAPGDAVAARERGAAHVLVDTFADFLDDADDLMAENPRTW